MQRPPPGPLSVGALTRQIKSLLEDRFYNIWVEGELGSLSVAHSGHAYLSLKDAEARIDAVVWRDTVPRLRFKPEVGDKVRVFGRLSVYGPRGTYQLTIEQIEQVGRGELQVAFEALKRKLMAEGLFDSARKRPRPFLPRGVGVITSPTGAARRDIEAVIHRRCPHVPIFLYPAKVQGAGSIKDVVDGLRAMRYAPVDVVIVGRGGGSMEDLWTFNEEAVARAIAACPIPVISAVGHETDTTIADLVADLRAPTPSAAAEAAVPVRDELRFQIQDLADRLDAGVARALRRAQERTARHTQRLERGLAFHDRRLSISRLSARLDGAIQRQLGAARAQHTVRRGRLEAQSPSVRLRHARVDLNILSRRLLAVGPTPARVARHRLDGLVARLRPQGPRAVASACARFATEVARLEALSPLASLARGYSITRHAGRVIRHADQVKVGDEVEVKLHRGTLTARVVETAVSPDHLDTEIDRIKGP